MSAVRIVTTMSITRFKVFFVDSFISGPPDPQTPSDPLLTPPEGGGWNALRRRPHRWVYCWIPVLRVTTPLPHREGQGVGLWERVGGFGF